MTRFEIPFVAVLLFLNFVLYQLGYHSGYIDGLHDGWWARDQYQPMYSKVQ